MRGIDKVEAPRRQHGGDRTGQSFITEKLQDWRRCSGDTMGMFPCLVSCLYVFACGLCIGAGFVLNLKYGVRHTWIRTT